MINGVVYGVPNTGGAVPTAAQVLANANSPNLVDSADYTVYQPDRERHSGMVRVSQEFGSWAEVSLTSLYSRRTSTSFDFLPTTIRIPSNSPYYIPGLVAGNGPLVLNYPAALNQGAKEQRNLDESWNTSFDYRADLAADWQLSGFVTYGENSGCGACVLQLNPFITGSNGTSTGLLTNSAPLFNPYSLTEQAAFQRAYGINRQASSFRLFDTVAKLEGKLFALPAGSVRVALGGEYTFSKMGLINTSAVQNAANTPQRTRNTSLSRKVHSAFGELFIPVFGADNATGGFQRLDLSLAVRYDKYSDFGDTTNPKFGFTYKPIDELTIRGSWGTAFRAPTLSEINPGVIELATRLLVTNNSGDPAIPITNAATGQSRVLNRVGNTVGLKPETASVWSLGFDATPVPGLKFGVTYYNVDYKDRIQFLDLGTQALASPANRSIYTRFITPAPQPATCVPGVLSTYNPVYQAVLNSPNLPAGTDTVNDCQLVALLYGGQQNLGRVKQDGLDFTAAYMFDAGIGNISLGANFSKVLNLKRSIVEGAPLVSVLDTIGFQVSSRGRANVGFSSGGFAANVYGNYVGSYLNNVTVTVGGVRKPDTKIPAWTTFDANLSYSFDEDNSSGILQGTRINLSVTNVFDRDPPIVLSGAQGFDAGNANPFGRQWTIELTKKF